MRLVLVAAAVILALAGYRWWNSPERQIHRLLDEVASALTHQEAETDLRAVAAVAGLREHLTADVIVETEEGRPPTIGRQDVVATAARIRVSVPMMRVQFFDPIVARMGESDADVEVTAQVTTVDRDGELAAAYDVRMTLLQLDGRWQVSRARIVGRTGSSQ